MSCGFCGVACKKCGTYIGWWVMCIPNQEFLHVFHECVGTHHWFLHTDVAVASIEVMGWWGFMLWLHVLISLSASTNIFARLLTTCMWVCDIISSIANNGLESVEVSFFIGITVVLLSVRVNMVVCHLYNSKLYFWNPKTTSLIVLFCWSFIPCTLGMRWEKLEVPDQPTIKIAPRKSLTVLRKHQST